MPDDTTPADPVAAYLAELRDLIANGPHKPKDNPLGARAREIGARVRLARLLKAVEAALALHQRAGQPTLCWDLDLRCPAHDWTKSIVRNFGVVRDCPDCGSRERFYCTTCREGEWPCREYQDITRALLGEDGTSV